MGAPYDARVRTTLTIDDDLYALVEQRAAREHNTVKDVITDALRASLQPPCAEPYRVELQHSALQPGIDGRRLNQLADQLVDELAMERLAR